MLTTLFNWFNLNEDKKTYKYGWEKDGKWESEIINHFDGNYSSLNIFTYLKSYDNIKYLDLRNDTLIPIYDQLDLDSSTANAISYCYEFDLSKRHDVNIINPSRLFIYYNQRKLQKNKDSESTNLGLSIHTGLNILHNIGICAENTWQYINNNYDILPSDEAYVEALNNKSVTYNAIDQDLKQIKSALINNYPVLFGFNVYDSFHNDNTTETGVVTVPLENEKLINSQAGVIVGFDDGDCVFIVRNSWGNNWGDQGYCYMPYEYILNSNLCSEFWILRQCVYANSDDINQE